MRTSLGPEDGEHIIKELRTIAQERSRSHCHFTLVPAQPMAWAPFLVVLALALAAGTAGVLAFQRRDLRC